jgi:hypothetical protein
VKTEYIEPEAHVNLPPSDPVHANTNPIDPLTALGITLPVAMLYRAERAEFLLKWARENSELSDEAKLSLERRVVETDGVRMACGTNVML